MGIPRVQFSDTVPLPINTVTVAGEGMTLYILDTVSYQKILKCYAAHHCISLTVLQVVFSQAAGDTALCCAEWAWCRGGVVATRLLQLFHPPFAQSTHPPSSSLSSSSKRSESSASECLSTAEKSTRSHRQAGTGRCRSRTTQ